MTLTQSELSVVADAFAIAIVASLLVRELTLCSLLAAREDFYRLADVVFGDAIVRHAGEASLARTGYERLSPQDRERLLVFLRSL